MHLRILPLLAVLSALDPPRGPEMADLLQNKSVQDELKITPEQHKRFRQVAQDFEKEHKDEIAQARQGKDFRKLMDVRQHALAAMGRALTDVLTPEQVRRLGQIEVQSHGVKALLRSEVQKKLGLNVKQREEVRSIYEGMEKEIRKLLEIPPADVRKAQELGKKLRKVHQDALEQALFRLDDEQRAIWKEMTGEPFEVQLEIARPQP
jgi:hypothetical protein